MGVSASATQQQVQSASLLTDRHAAKALEADCRRGSSGFLHRRISWRHLVASSLIATLSASSSAILLSIAKADSKAETVVATSAVDLVAEARAEKYLAAVRANNGSLLSSARSAFFRLDCPGRDGQCQCGAKDDYERAEHPNDEFLLPIASTAGGRVRALHPGHYFIAVQVAARPSSGSPNCVNLVVSRTRNIPGGAGGETEDVLCEVRATLDGGSASPTVLYTSKLSALERGDELSALLQCAGRAAECYLSVSRASYLSLYLVADAA